MGILDVEFKWDNREFFLESLCPKDQVRFAVLCLEQSLYATSGNPKYLKRVIHSLKMWLEDREGEHEYKMVREILDKSGSFSAYATRIADGAVCKGLFCIDLGQGDIFKEEQMDYLKELVLNNLSEEDRECWLLVASL